MCHATGFSSFCRLNPQRASKIDNRFSILIGYFLNKGLQLNQKDVCELKVSPFQLKSWAIVYLYIWKSVVSQLRKNQWTKKTNQSNAMDWRLGFTKKFLERQFVFESHCKGQVLRFGEHNIAHLRRELHAAIDEQKNKDRMNLALITSPSNYFWLISSELISVRIKR